MKKTIKSAWHHAHPYTMGATAMGACVVFNATERSYMSPVPETHLIWLWGLSCVAFILFNMQMRTQLNTILMTTHGFIENIRHRPLYAKLVHLHQRAIQWCRWAYLTSFVFGAFYYLFPNAYAFQVWIFMVVTAKLLMNRATHAFNMAQATYHASVDLQGKI